MDHSKPYLSVDQGTIGSGDVLLLNVDSAAEAMTLKPAKAKPRYQLADLMAQCDLNAGACLIGRVELDASSRA